MAVNNSLVNKSKADQKLSMAMYLSDDAVVKHINKVVGSEEGQRFIASIIAAVTATPTLQECTNQSIVSAALVGHALKLLMSPQLGHFYMVPFNDKNKGKVAQFQMGYKGYIQLAIRSGQYKKLNVIAVKQGELEYFDPLNEDIKINLMVDDWDAREAAPTIGYYAMFELTNGFRKAIYWSKEQMLAHADKYSAAFSRDETVISTKYGEKKKVSYSDYVKGNYDPKDEWMYSSFWYRNFDGMAYKTMLRQLLSKWGVMSIEMQSAFLSDMGVMNDDGSVTYVESDDSIDFEPEQESVEPAESVPQNIEAEQSKPQQRSDISAALFGNK